MSVFIPPPQLSASGHCIAFKVKPLLCLLNLILASDADVASYTFANFANLCKQYDTSNFSCSLTKTCFFLSQKTPPILHIRWVGISIIIRKGWKAQICGKGKTPKWALGGSRVTRPWPLPDVDGKMMALMSHFVTYPINHQ